MAVNTLYLRAALFSEVAFANRGILGSKIASEASFIISRRFISDIAFKDAMGIFPELIAQHLY